MARWRVSFDGAVDKLFFTVITVTDDDFDTWTVGTIRSRQAWMARQATSIWHMHF